MATGNRRRSPRLQDFDYATVGAYFVTICVQGRRPLLGRLVASDDDTTVQLSDAGRMVQDVWLALPDHYPRVALDAFVIMPNHLHGILWLRDPPDDSASYATGPMALPDVVQRFKSFTTSRYRHGVYESGWPPFDGRLWQRNYNEHMIRSDESVEAIREYVDANPWRWPWDAENVFNATA